MDFNSALEKVGDFGLYQKLLCVFLVVPSASLCALVYFTQFFILMVPDHSCKLPHSDSIHYDQNMTLQFEYRAEKCALYRNITDSGSNVSISHTACKEWVYNFTELYPTLATEMNWVCDDDQVPYQIQTVFYIGTSLGCIIFGLIADRFGRRPSILLSYVVACVAGVGSAFTYSFYSFAALRFFVGATIIPLSEDPYVLSLEYIGVKRRTLAIVLWAAGYIVFSAICPWFAYLLKDWQMLCIATSVPLALIPLCGILIPESASWLLTQNKTTEAINMLKVVAKVNGNEFPQEYEDTSMEKLAEQENKSSAATVLDLFRTPRLRRNSIIMALTWFVVYCCYHTNTQNASNLGTNTYESFTYSALVEIPAQFVIFFGIDWLGRRWPMVVAAFVAGVAGLFIMLVPAESPTTFLALALIQRVTLTIVYNIIMQYSAELYPTVVRGRGLAFLRFMGTMGLYLSPSIVYLAISNPAFPLLVSGCLCIGISVTGLFLPETLHQHLPHTIQEGESFGADQKIMDFPCLNKRNSMEREHIEDSL